MIEDVDELLAMYDEGAYSIGDLFHQLTLLVPGHPLQPIVDALPGGVREGFVTWLRKTYDNDLPTDGFVFIGTPPSPEENRARFEALRAWLRLNPERAA